MKTAVEWLVDNGIMLAEGQIFKKLKHNDKYRVHRTTRAE